MNRRMNKFGVIATVFVLVVCLVIVTGSTFSLFTSESNNDIAINSGKLELSAKLDALKLYSKDVEQADKFANGGTANLNDAKTELTLKNVTPGDKVTLNIVLTNNSNVDLQYRINWAVTGELADALTAKVGNADITSGTSEWTLWTAPATDAEKTQTLTLSIELPLTADNTWQDKEAKISFTVEAVQANGTGEYSSVAFVNTAAGLQAAIDSGATEIILNDDITLDGTLVIGATEITLNDDITLDSALVIGESAGNNTRRAARRFADNDTEESKPIVINLNGKTLTSKVAEGAAIVNNADVVITNGTVVAENGVAFENNATATLEEVTISGAVASKGADATLTLNESTVTVEDAETPAISATEGGAVVVNGGTYTNTEDDGVVVSGNVTITDGSFDGKLEAGDGENNAPVISGGNFTEAPSEELLPEGYRPVQGDDGYILVPNAEGEVTIAYTSQTGFWGEGGGNAYESFVVTLYEGENVIATASLNNIDNIIDGDLYVTWQIPFTPSGDEYWNVTWAENYPNVYMNPTKVTLTIDGVEVDENVHRWNAPDDLSKIVAVAEGFTGGVKAYTNLTDAMGKFNGRTVRLLQDVTADITGFYGVEFVTDVEGGVTITNTYTEEWIDFDDVIVGAGVTVNATDVFSGDSENVILGAFNVTGTYYHGYDAKTTVKDGGKITVDGTTIVRYNENADSGIYIYGDGDDSTVEFDCSYYIGAYSGTFYAKDATINAGYFLLKNSYDNDNYADVALILDNSTITIVGTKDTQDSFIIDDKASITMKNGSAIKDVRDFNILAGAQLTLDVDADSYFEATNTNLTEGYIFIDGKIFKGTVGVTVTTVDELKAAITNAVDGTVIIIANDITVTDRWDNRYGGRTDKAVTIEGCGNTLKFTGEINDGLNYHAVFRFTGAATVKDLTFDFSEAVAGTYLRAISAASDLVVSNCTFIGSDNYTKDNAIQFGDTNATAQIDASVSITNCTFINWRRGISDNENAKEVKSVVISGNTFEGANAYISVYDNVTFTNNTLIGSLVNVTSYTNAANAKVTILDNVLDAEQDNVVGSASKVFTAANVNAQDGVVVNAQ